MEGSLLQKRCELLILKVYSLKQICCVDRECPNCGVIEPVGEVFTDVNEYFMVSYYE